MSVNVLNQQLDEFVRSVHIQYFFHDNVCMYTRQLHKLCIKSEWTPPFCLLWIQIPLAVIRLELCSLLRCHRHHYSSSNLSRSEFKSSHFCSLNNAMILPADKNLGPTIVTKSWYKNEVSQ